MTRIGEVVINNCGAAEEGWAVVRNDDGALWCWGVYETSDKASEVAKELGKDAIVARLID